MTHICQVCGQGFTFSTHLREHLFTHSDSKPYKCRLCGKTFATAIKLKYHSSVHKSKQRFQCETCHKYFKSKTTLKQHCEIHSGKIHDCQECGKQFKTKANLKAHVKTHSGIKDFRCEVCSKQFTTKGALRHHLYNHGGFKPYKCNICDKRFAYKPARNRHFLLHTGGKKHKCDICNRKFMQRTELERHVLGHTGEKPYKCDSCEKAYKSASELKLHKKSHDVPAETYPCSICGKIYSGIKSIDSHMRNRHGHREDSGNGEPESYTCEVCGKVFGYKLTYANHKRAVHGEKKYSCTHCDKKFAVAGYLSRHLKTHAESHACEVCGKTFNAFASLVRHQVVHSNDKPFSCELCFKTFKYAVSLRQHKKANHSESYHTCKKCNLTFEDQQSLIKHQEFHSEGEPFACGVCSQTFKFMQCAKNHLRDAHPGHSAIIRSSKNFEHCFIRCERCGGEFQKRCELERHLCITEGERGVGGADQALLRQADVQPTNCASNSSDRSDRENAPESDTSPGTVSITQEASSAAMGGRFIPSDLDEPRERSSSQKDAVTDDVSTTMQNVNVISENQHESYKSEADISTSCIKAQNVCHESYPVATSSAENNVQEDSEASCQAMTGEGNEIGGRGNLKEQLVDPDETVQRSAQLSSVISLCGELSVGCENANSDMFSIPSGERKGRFTRSGQALKTMGKVTAEHMKMNYSSPTSHSKPRHQCQDCNKDFPSKRSLGAHRRVHPKHDVYNCSKCPKTFKTNSELSEHVNLHANEMFACGVCGLPFAETVYLSKHIKTHIDDGTLTFDTVTAESGPVKLEAELDGEQNLQLDDNSLTHDTTKFSGISKNENKPNDDLTDPCDNGVLAEVLPECESTDLARTGSPSADELSTCPDVHKQEQSESEHEDGALTKEIHKSDRGAKGQPEASDTEVENEIEAESNLEDRDSPEDDHTVITSLEGLKRNGSGPFMCKKCNRTYKKRSYLIRHCRETHARENARESMNKNEEGIFWCKDCSKGFKYKSDFARHRKTRKHQPDNGYPVAAGLYSCGICNESSKFHAQLVSHLYRHIDGLSCRTCNLTVDYLGDLKQHMLTHGLLAGKTFHPTDIIDNLEAENCADGGTSTIETTKEDVAVVNGLEKQSTASRDQKKVKCRCSVCDKEFQYKSDLIRHSARHSDDKNYRCFVCNSYFKEKKSLKRHCVCHTGNNLMCLQCEKSFENQKELSNHMLLHGKYESSEERSAMDARATGRFTCEFCKDTFEDSYDLDEHRSLHYPFGEICCDICQKYFKTTGEAQSHSETHIGETHSCVKCGTDFENKTLLSHHLFTYLRFDSKTRSGHTKLSANPGGKKSLKVKCPVCDHRFKYNSDLKNHMVKHSTDKNYRCFICNSYYKIEKSLKRHFSTHVGAGFCCRQCKTSFQNETEVSQHMRLHGRYEGGKKNAEKNRKEQYVCEFCGDFFGDSSEFDKHRSMHYPFGEIRCDICQEYFKTTEESRRHIDTHNSEKKSCVKCGVEFENAAMLRDHLLSYLRFDSKIQHTDIDKTSLACDVCDYIAKSEASLKKHTSHKHSKPFKLSCATCTFRCRKVELLRKHEARHRAGGRHQCKKCGQTFSLFLDLRAHNRVEHRRHPAPAKRGFMCEECGKILASQSSLNVHKKYTHGTVRPYACTECDRTFILRCELKLHKLTHTGEKPYICEVCGEAFKQRSVMTTHVLQHSGVHKYYCNICEKGFLRQAYMKVHMRVHTDERPYHCKYCPKTLRTQSHLIVHERIHTGEKPYPCDVCGKRFITRTVLDSHKLIHTDTRKFACRFCNKKVRTKSHLANHENIHTGTKPYKCKLCDKAFVQSGSLKSHMRTHTNTKVLTAHTSSS